MRRAGAVRWQTTESAKGSGSNLPFTVEDVPAEMLRHAYWDGADGISPYTMPWDLLISEEGESGENLANIFANDTELLSGEYLRQ